MTTRTERQANLTPEERREYDELMDRASGARDESVTLEEEAANLRVLAGGLELRAMHLLDRADEREAELERGLRELAGGG